MLNAIRLAQETRAILVGTPTGGRPNGYGEVRSFELPNSKLGVTYCTKYFRAMPASDPASLVPEVLVPSGWADYLADRDPVLEAVLSRR
jgi:hypothetical protein